MTYILVDKVKEFVAALTGAPDTVMDWRCIHDTDKGAQAIPMRGSIDSVSETLDYYNARGYGVFVVINELDGQGREASNIVNVRSHFIDYDDPDTQWLQLQATRAWQLPPTFYVLAAIPGKFHAYWRVDKYMDAQRFEVVQRKLVQLWHSDPKPIDLPRVMRVPGTVHSKNPAQPVYVAFMQGSGATYQVGALEWALANVVIDQGGGGVERAKLGDDKKAAPSFEWAKYALFKIDPNQCQRDDWLKITAAFKQAALHHVDDSVARQTWDSWCAQYTENDPPENEKLWRSIRDTKTGWSFLERASGVAAERLFGGENAYKGPTPGQGVSGNMLPQVLPTPDDPPGMGHAPQLGAFLTPEEQKLYFRGCFLIESMGLIYTPMGRFMGPTKFNASYGGKIFVLDANNEKTTDEPWKAATRGQVFSVPKVDGVRFLPIHKPGEIIVDELGRRSVNTYIPAIINSKKGSVEPFMNHITKLIPDERDRRILFNYMRHCVQRKGVKAFWAPVIQSTQGAGKGIIKHVMTNALGGVYVYAPNAKELTEGGGKFNAWMRSKLMIIADEIKVDDRRDMIEVLKPLITEDRIEIQSKGVDQEMADNVANWIMFTNHKDAVPIVAGDRRYAIFFSAIQDVRDIEAAGWNGSYFPDLYNWLATRGAATVTHWLENSAIEPEFDPIGAAHRAPVTSSTSEAIVMSRGNIEHLIVEAVANGRPGFKDGWISSSAVQKMLKEENVRASHSAIGSSIKNLGYFFIGRAGGKYFEEDMKQPNVYSINPSAVLSRYATDQGYRL